MWQEDLVHELNSAGHREKGQIMARWSAHTGVSVPQLYRVAREKGYTSGRKPRADKGALKCGLTEGQIEFVAALVYQTRREVKGPIMPVKVALEMACDSGIIEPGQVSVSRMQQLLNARQINAAALKTAEPAQSMRSLHPNHYHVVDVSVCIQYYLRGQKGLRIMDERNFYKNKLHHVAKIRLRLLRYVVVDHFSGAFYFRYFNTTGETQANLYDFLLEAWGPKSDPRLPFRGVPFGILWDAGSANISRAMKGFIARLGIETPPGMPHNARRQGAAEVIHNFIEGQFEAGLRLQPAHTIEELNAWALDRCIYLNAACIHSRHGMSRNEAWLLIIRPDQIRDLPSSDMLQDIYSYTAEDFTREVSKDYSISYRGKPWSVRHISGILPRLSTVQIVIKPFTPDLIDVIFQGVTYECRPIETLAPELGGFRADAAIIGQGYKSQPETATQKAVRRFDNMAFGEEKKKNAIPFEGGLRVFGHHADKVAPPLAPAANKETSAAKEGIAYIGRTGSPVEVDRSILDREIPLTEFLKRLIARVGPISKDLNRSLRDRYGTSIGTSEAERAMTEIEDGTYQVQGSRLKAQGNLGP